MSRGPGRWQKQLLSAVGGNVVASVSGVVKTSVVSPVRDDFTSARRAARQLALSGQVAALYCHTCARCSEIQDVEEPHRCCGPVRSMLAVVKPERRRLILHPAPAPGGEPPVWINAVTEPRSPGQLPVADLADLAALALRRCYEQLGSGDVAVSLREAVAATRLFWQMQKDEAGPVRDKALADLAEAEHAVMALRAAVIRRSGQDEWRELWGEVRKELDRAREHRRAREALRATAGLRR